jgi:hypothetical protein
MNDRLSWADYRVFKSAGEPFIFAVEDASLFSLSGEAHETLCRWRSSEFIDLDRVSEPDLEVLQGLRDARVLQPAARQKVAAPRPRPGCTALSTLVLEVAQALMVHHPAFFHPRRHGRPCAICLITRESSKASR